MARPINPERHRERRLAIIDAAMTCFARNGIDGATTAEICREAGIGSGTFFHYFPTKLDVLLAILELGMEESAAWFEAAQGEPIEVLLAHVDHTAAEAADERTAGFVLAVAGSMHHPDVARALAAEREALIAALQTWAERAQQAGQVRPDWTGRELATWLLALEDAFVSAVATDPAFAPAEQAARLRDLAVRMLRP